MKKKLRNEILKNRNLLTYEDIQEKSHDILNLLKSFKTQFLNRNILIFIDFKSEVLTKPIIEYLSTVSKNIFIPKINTTTKKMELYKYTSHKDLIKSSYGILEPKHNPSKIIDPKILDVVITPGVAFDLQGYRIGYGGGFYDKLFSNTSNELLKIAIGFELQIIDSLPIEKHDKKIDYLVTEINIYKF